jgi:hypothetical protein
LTAELGRWQLAWVTKLQEIEKEIERLPREQFFELVRHLRERHAGHWDDQVEQDAQSGRLHKFYERLQKEEHGEPEMPLEAFLDDEVERPPATRSSEGRFP